MSSCMTFRTITCIESDVVHINHARQSVFALDAQGTSGPALVCDYSASSRAHLAQHAGQGALLAHREAYELIRGAT